MFLFQGSSELFLHHPNLNLTCCFFLAPPSAPLAPQASFGKSTTLTRRRQSSEVIRLLSALEEQPSIQGPGPPSGGHAPSSPGHITGALPSATTALHLVAGSTPGSGTAMGPAGTGRAAEVSLVLAPGGMGGGAATAMPSPPTKIGRGVV